MPRRRSPSGAAGAELPAQVDGPSSAEPKYPRPKILVIDALDISTALRQRGYAATSGTFGQPLAVPRGAGFLPVTSTAELPGHTEQEVLVADLCGPEAQVASDDQLEMPPPGVMSIWTSADKGLIDLRPIAMTNVRSEMDRIYKHGGVFILFPLRV